MSRAESTSFDVRAERGVFWEKQLHRRMKRKFYSFPEWVSRSLEIQGIESSHIDYETDPQLQKDGVDGVFSLPNIEFDYKTRTHDYYANYDILVDDWVQNEETDIVVYSWESSNGRNLVDGVLLYLNDEFRSWFHDNKDRFMSKPDGTVVDIDEIPDKHIYTEFDPNFPEDFTPSEVPPAL